MAAVLATSSHWYDRSRLPPVHGRAHRARGSITVREFISEFDGMSGTPKQKMVLVRPVLACFAATTSSGRHSERAITLRSCWPRSSGTASCQACTTRRHRQAHFYRMMEAAGVTLKTFTYNRNFGRNERRSARGRVCLRSSSRWFDRINRTLSAKSSPC